MQVQLLVVSLQRNKALPLILNKDNIFHMHRNPISYLQFEIWF